MTTTGVQTVTVPQKLDKLETVLNGVVYERNRVIETAIVALVAKKHHLQVSEPGTGKTYLVDELVKLIDGLHDNYFRWLMTRHTTPEEVFGPPSLKGLRNDEYRRNTAHKLPTAFVAFLDEMFKANSSILNGLLTIMNEGLFFNDGDSVEVPLSTVFAGSNELPREIELAAFWDRITFRLELHSMREKGSRLAMLQARAKRAFRTVAIEPIISWAEIVQAQETAARVEVPDVVLDTMLALWDNLHKEGIEPSDRRFNDCIPIIQATAFRSGRSVADVDDMRLLRHVLWLEIGQQPVVDRLVLELANPLDKEVMDLITDVDELAKQADEVLANTDNMGARRRKAVEIHGKLSRTGDELDKLEDKIKKSPKRSDMLAEAKSRLANVVNLLLEELFGIKEPE